MEIGWTQIGVICTLIMTVMNIIAGKREEGRREQSYARQDQLSDLKEYCAKTFVSKETLDLRLDPIEDKVEEIKHDVKDMVGKVNTMSGEITSISRFIKESTKH